MMMIIMIMMMMMKIILLLALPTAAPIGCHPPALVVSILHRTLFPVPRRGGRGGACEWGWWDERGSTRGGGGAGEIFTQRKINLHYGIRDILREV